MFKHDRQKGRDQNHCTFCGKHQDQVDRLIAGPNVFICDACVRLCNDILGREKTPAR